LLGQPATEASDLYTVGVLAYRLLAGTHPFDIYAEDTIGEILEGEPDWSKVQGGGELTAVVRTLLAKQPADRYPTANQTITAFYQALGQAVPQETAVIRESYLQAATFVGREAEMSQLTEALTQAKQGQGSAWLIGGESGVGKSRLLRELQTQALVQGFQLLRGQGIQDGGGTPYHLWREPLRQLIIALPDVDDFTASVLQPLMPDISQLLGREIQSAPELPNDAARIRLFTIISQLFRQTKRPLLLILEDLHWAEESLFVIPYLTRLLEEYPILFIGSYRHDERPNLPEQLPNLTTLPLSRLTQEEMANLSLAMLGQAGKKQAVMELLLRETEGNTFFVVEVVRALAEAAGRLGNIGEMELPEHLFPNGIKSIVAQRLSHLPETALPLLRQAAVAGRELDMLLIQSLAVEVDVDRWWLPLCNDAAVLEVQNGRWQFTHDKIRQGILLTLLPEQRATIHAQVALHLAQVYAQDPEAAATIAYHWREAGDEQQELVYRMIAAGFTLKQFAYDEALIHIERALTLTPDDEPHTRFELLYKQVQALHTLGRIEAETAILPQLTTLAETIGDPKLIVSAYTRQIDYQNDIGEYQAAAELAKNLADRFEKQEAEILFELYPAWAWGFLQHGKLQEALSVLDRAAPYLNNSQTTYKVRILSLRGSAELRMADHQAAIQSLEKAIDLAQTIDNKANLIAALNNLANVYNDQNLPHKAMVCLEQALQLNQQVGNQGLQLPLLINLSGSRFFLHDYQTAINLTQQALTLARTIGHQRNMIIASMNLGGMSGKLGKHEEGLKYARIGLNLLETTATEDIYLLGWAWFHLGENLYYLKQWEEAQAAFHRALAFRQQRGLAQHVVETQAWLARTILAGSDTKQAQVQIAPVLTFLEEVSAPVYDHSLLYFAAYEVLSAHQMIGAEGYLRTAYDILKASSSTLLDGVAQHTFWQGHVLHQEIMQAYDAYVAIHGITLVKRQSDKVLGTINGRYLLHNKLGQGGMGIVHRATDRLTGETVALKQVFLPVEQLMFSSRPASQTNRELRLALAHEFQTLAGLRHPNIISVLDYGFDENGQPFFTMSYLEGAQTILAAGNGRSVPEKITLLIQTLEALAYLHRRGILHRDLKPDNVLVVGDTVRVLDFGLAVAKEQATESVGSWLYMAPEVLLGQPATEASDLYTVGVLAYRLLAGTHPFDIYAEDTIGEILDGEPDWSKVQGGGELTAVSTSTAQAIVQKLLAKQPQDRYQTATETAIALYQALGQSVPQETAAIRESYLQAAKFVGREGEMAQLAEALTDATDGSGSAWLIGGESGIGKTRLISELRTQALVSGFQVLRGQAVEDGGQPYQVWRNPLRQLVITVPDIDNLTAGVLLPLVPDLPHLLNRPIDPAPDLEEGAAQARLLTTIARLFWMAKRPLLLILEDLHLAKVSLLPIPYLARTVAQHPLLILGSYRSDEHPNLPQDLPDMTHLHLPRLTPEAISDLSAAMLGNAGRNEAVQALLQRETEGNAFFAVEVVRALAEEAGHLGNIGQMKLPETLLPNGVQDVVQQRVARLPEKARELLVKTAVAGRTLELSLIKHLANDTDVENEWLPLCADAAVLDVQNGVWQFSHGKIRDGLYANLSPAQQVHLHQEVAQAIEACYPDDRQQASRLAYHWHRAHSPQKEQRYAWQAGQIAAEQFANADAITYFNQALAATPPDEIARQFEILLALEKTYDLTGQRGEGQVTLAQLAKLADALANPQQQMTVMLRQVDLASNLGRFADADQLAEQAIIFAQTHDLHQQLVLAHVLRARVLLIQGQPEACEAELQQAQTANQTIQDTRLELNILAIYRNLLEFQGNHQAALELAEQRLRRSRELGFKLQEAKSLMTLGLAHDKLHQYQQAKQCLQESLVLLVALGDRYSEGVCLLNLGNLFIRYGDYAAAQEILHTCLQVSRDVNDQMNEGIVLYNLGVIAVWQGRYADATAQVSASYAISQQISDREGDAYALTQLGKIHRLQGEYDEAQRCYRLALSLRQEMNQTHFFAENQIGLALLEIATGQDPQQNIDAVLAVVRADPIISGVDSPFEIYQDLVEALIQQNHPDVSAILLQAHNLLQKQAAQFEDDAMRQSFLENIPAHRQLVAWFSGYPFLNETINGRYQLRKKLG
ncbi:MAG: AAA family ATPase, partial [Anaerolineales bacterium]|nr:AAA family ATPase [Anaerolineales bacterium]